MKKWTLIINPASASSTTEGKWKEYLQMLTDGGLEVDYQLTDRQGHGIELANAAAAAGCRKFIAAGGDGTVHEVMTGLLRYCDATGTSMSDFTLAVLPYGTGNDWIKTAGIPSHVPDAIRCVIEGKTTREDVVRLTFENGVFCMANIGGIGLDADICHYTNRLKSSGHRGGILYKIVTVYALLSRKLHEVKIVCDDKMVYCGKLYSAVFANGIYRGGGVNQNEDGGDWSDGQLELSIMPGVTRMKAFGYMLHALSGDFAYQPGIITLRFRKMKVKPLDEADLVESDGELPGKLPLTVELTGEQINIISA